MPLIQWPPPLPDSFPPAAVVVWSPDGSHTGIVYLDETDKILFIHLAFHHDLRCEELRPGRIGWVLPANTIPQERLELVAAMCSRVWERNQKDSLPYGFRYDATRFHESGEIEIGIDECGLTCATFVLAIYRAVGLELLQLSSWPSRADDQAQFTRLLGVLNANCSDTKHIAAITREAKSTRYRPLEVAGGSCCSPPATFEDASARAVAIEKELAESLKAPS